MLAKDTERHVFATDELRDVKKQDVKLRSDCDGEVLTRFLEVADEAKEIVVKIHSKGGMQHHAKVPECLDEWLDLKGRAVLNQQLQLVDVL